MIAELQGYAAFFKSTHGLMLRSIDGLSEAQALERPDGANPLLWIAAHMVSVRCSIAKALGANVDVPWASQFPRGGEVANVTTWPSLADVRARWDEVHAAFMVRLESLTSAEVAAATPAPSLDRTVLGTVGLGALHDAYHVGQLAAGRRRHGMDRLVG